MGMATKSGDYVAQMTSELWPATDEDRLTACGDVFTRASSQRGRMIENWARGHDTIFRDRAWSVTAADIAGPVLRQRWLQPQRRSFTRFARRLGVRR